MTVSDHLETWHGLPVVAFPDADSTAELPGADEVAWRISADPFGDSDETWPQTFARFLDAVDPSAVRALVIGVWGEMYDESSELVINELLAVRDRFSNLRALFVGDVTFEESEISWINQSDVTPLLSAFDQLLEFGVRGGEHLAFPPASHATLRSLVVQTGGLDGEVVRGIAASDFPALEHLDIWLGTSWYGGNATVADLEPLLQGTRLPKLRSLALRNSEIQDEIAAALASAPVVPRLSTLDLSMGTLGDEGVEALLGGQPLTHLKNLDLHHHFIGESMRNRLLAALPGVEVDLSECESDSGEREERYTAVAE
ncbi:STM4015 family protein [Nocardia spumae]|uniref:STM4015 family protein n=1 Tax=Nocardia spumae TaxID=2887190 RepID=UPI001D13A922|nr:STM4015 family protein [Nocardia spumae]